METIRIQVEVDAKELEEAIEKASRLKALLNETKDLIDSLSGKEKDILFSGIKIANLSSDDLVEKYNQIAQICCRTQRSGRR